MFIEITTMKREERVSINLMHVVLLSSYRNGTYILLQDGEEYHAKETYSELVRLINSKKTKNKENGEK